jgi:autotransporter family porin
VHDFLDPEALRVGDNGGNYVRVSESYNKSYGELGFGVDGYVSKSTTLFGDFRYQQSFSNGSGERKGRSVNLGVRFQF